MDVVNLGILTNDHVSCLLGSVPYSTITNEKEKKKRLSSHQSILVVLFYSADLFINVH